MLSDWSVQGLPLRTNFKLASYIRVHVRRTALYLTAALHLRKCLTLNFRQCGQTSLPLPWIEKLSNHPPSLPLLHTAHNDPSPSSHAADKHRQPCTLHLLWISLILSTMTCIYVVQDVKVPIKVSSALWSVYIELSTTLRKHAMYIRVLLDGFL